MQQAGSTPVEQEMLLVGGPLGREKRPDSKRPCGLGIGVAPHIVLAQGGQLLPHWATVSGKANPWFKALRRPCSRSATPARCPQPVLGEPREARSRRVVDDPEDPFDE